ncbi:sugar phosphate isomerase/epimerase [Microbacterium terricola]|uniref:Uncharacterized protein n=1 Tax=Microbacterium terricola TaxID=344163 RepID=A0ABM8E1Z1_9MICO|nr:sugar phosphate isomerase/epimerase [Microbacterium terricola]UYK40319.1 sugar phosphate isomerase/epimerase [Microbacterium terricola]BDV31967.1 hypothetical protein Microterr_26270 [Microbacterium terricola]
MTLPPLRDDSLITSPGGAAVRISLPWIRSLPLASLQNPIVTIDGARAEDITVVLDDRHVPAAELTEDDGWWFQQDRLTLAVPHELTSGVHDVAVEFWLRIPYLQVGPDGPLTLPFREERPLVLDAPHVSAVVATDAGPVVSDGSLPAGWVLTASAFNWTPEMIAAERDAVDIAIGIVEDDLAVEIEAEPGQLWRSFPGRGEADASAFGERLAAAGGRVSILGASIDDWSPQGTRRTDDERFAFLLPQIEIAHQLGARGLRLPIGQAGRPLLDRVLPILHETGLTLFEEIQGSQTPGSPQAGSAIDQIVGIDDPHVRLLVDISMFMPALPESYLQRLQDGGVPPELIDTLRHRWRDAATVGGIVDLLRSGGVPASVHTLYMDMLVRFGRSEATVIADVLPWIGAFHLKFWDLDDSDDRVSGPIRELGALLRGTGFEGTLCSEWGGHEWLDDDPTAMTRDHLAMARRALNGASA